MTKPRLYTFYYLTLAILLAVSIVQTVYEGSLHITYGRKVANLEIQKKDLIARQAQLQNSLAQEVSLASINDFTRTQGFVAINQTVAFADQSNIVASR